MRQHRKHSTSLSRQNDPDNNEYVLTVIATEVRPAGSDEVALSTELGHNGDGHNVDEPGMVTLEPPADPCRTTGVTATDVDPDNRR